MHALLKLELDFALKLICKNPATVEAKIGDLYDAYVYKLRLPKQQYLLDYRILDPESIKFLILCSYENDYRNLKR